MKTTKFNIMRTYYIFLLAFCLLGCNNQPSKQKKESESITKIEIPVQDTTVIRITDNYKKTTGK